MKSKIASILGLIIPVSIALMLTAFLGCGGGGSPYGNTAHVYDGTWSLNLKGYSLPGETTPSTGKVSCTERFTPIVITYGSGTVTQIMDCSNTATTPIAIDIGVTLTPDATGITGTVQLITTGGGPSPSSGKCSNREQCTAGAAGAGLSMFKCGTAAAAPGC